eukprot:Nk52_evm3s206 gene=Nk52_evmTU3s206
MSISTAEELQREINEVESLKAAVDAINDNFIEASNNIKVLVETIHKTSEVVQAWLNMFSDAARFESIINHCSLVEKPVEPQQKEPMVQANQATKKQQPASKSQLRKATASSLSKAKKKPFANSGNYVPF